MINEKKYDEAFLTLEELKEIGFKDSEEIYNEAKYNYTMELIESENLEKALPLLEELSKLEYKDSKELFEEISNNKNTLKHFVERYNTMMETLDKQGKAACNINIEKFDEKGKLKLPMSSATISFNNEKNGEKFKTDITNINFSCSISSEYDAMFALCELYATIAGFVPDTDYAIVENIINNLLDNSEFTYNEYNFKNYSFTNQLMFVGQKN